MAALPAPHRADAKRRSVHVQFPSAIEATYKRKLLARVSAAQTLLLRKLARLIAARRKAEAAAEKEAARGDAAAEPDLADWLKVVEEVRVAYTAAFPPPEGELGALAKQLDLFTTGHVTRTIQTVAAIDIGKQPGLTKLYQTWTSGNVDLIKSIDAVHFDQIRDVVYDAVKTGKTTDRLIADLQERYSVTRSRAELIARDQVGKLNGQITMQRQVSVGVSRYKWMSSHDERVRASHRALDGEVFAWNDPPPEGHPGYPVQCRCSAIPVWDDEG